MQLLSDFEPNPKCRIQKIMRCLLIIKELQKNIIHGISWRTLSYLFSILFIQSIRAQAPANDNCPNAIDLTQFLKVGEQWCSDKAQYTTTGATESYPGSAPACWPGTKASNDVWFTFTAIAPDVQIGIYGAASTGGGGTLKKPTVALHLGTCSNNGFNFQTLECGWDDNADNVEEIYQGGLTIGQTYIIQVDGVLNNGTFKICINNYFAPANPSSDCPTGSILCDKSGFAVQSVTGAGFNTSEMDDATCFSGGAPVNNEINSTWFKWICDQSGTLTFTLTPNNPGDDLDFVVYELPNGINSCNGKILQRCMASGESFIPSPCMGPTGLKNGESDISEDAGCSTPGKNNFIKPLDMVSGKAYALVVNNFTSTGNGFAITWGGTGTFLGPKPNILASATPPKVCAFEPITYTDNSTFQLGSIVDWKWNFGKDASTKDSTGKGPFEITYSTPGKKTVLLNVTSDKGCITPTVIFVDVDTCCDTYNKINYNSNVTDLKCFDIYDGSIQVNAVSGSPIKYQWDNGSTQNVLTDLASGDYHITLTNPLGCNEAIDFTIKSPPELLIPYQEIKPTCNGGKDGQLTLTPTGGVPGYQYDWQDGMGFTTNNSKSNLPVGDYPVTIKDANGCIRDITIELRELVLTINPALKAVTEPLCFGDSNGSITLTMTNGLGPFQYNFGSGFQSSPTLPNIPAGTYQVTVLDANQCQGKFTFKVDQPLPLMLDASKIDISCFGANDGNANASASGGVGNYTFQWSNNTAGASTSQLPPGGVFVTVMDGNGCTTTKNLNIIEPPELFLFPVAITDVICHGENTGAVLVQGAGGNPGYFYSSDGINYQDSAYLENLSAGNQLLYIKDNSGCIDTLQVTIDEPPPLIVYAGPDQKIELGDEVQLNADIQPGGALVAVQWIPTINMACPTCPTTLVKTPKTTTYTVTIQDSTGCRASDKVLVIVDLNRPVYPPNVFSPNNDGINDKFMIHTNKAAELILEFKVYNRWGGLLFEGYDITPNDISRGWDGTFGGEPLGPDVYTWYALIRFIDKAEIIFEGDVTIFR